MQKSYELYSSPGRERVAKGSEVTTKREDGHKSGHSGASERVNGGGGSLAFCWPEFEHVVSGRRAALGQHLSTVRGGAGV